MLPTGRPNGFTFVELLVVLGIVALLASIGFAISGPVREKARQSVCMAQLRQLHTAVMLYTEDSDAGEEVPGLGPLSASVARTGLRGLRPYLNNEEILSCPDLPRAVRGKVATSYIWIPVPSSAIPEPSPGEKGMLRDQAEQIATLGTGFPMWRCNIHDEVFYQPREAPIAPLLSTPFVIEITVDGSVQAGRKPYRRIKLIEAWASLP